METKTIETKTDDNVDNNKILKKKKYLGEVKQAGNKLHWAFKSILD